MSLLRKHWRAERLIRSLEPSSKARLGILFGTEKASKASLHHLLVDHLRKSEQDVHEALADADSALRSYLFKESVEWTRTCLSDPRNFENRSTDGIVQDIRELLLITTKYLKEVKPPFVRRSCPGCRTFPVNEKEL